MREGSSNYLLFFLFVYFGLGLPFQNICCGFCPRWICEIHSGDFGKPSIWRVQVSLSGRSVKFQPCRSQLREPERNLCVVLAPDLAPMCFHCLPDVRGQQRRQCTDRSPSLRKFTNYFIYIFKKKKKIKTGDPRKEI